LVTLPPKPVGVTPERLIPCASATRRAIGVAFTSAPFVAVPLAALIATPSPPVGDADAASSPAACEEEDAASAAGPAAGAPPDPSSPGAISASGEPTGTSSSTSASSAVIVPSIGAGTSASTLSVETSTTVSPSLTLSPSATCHSRTMPSVTDSPISGIAICTVAVSGISIVQSMKPGVRAAPSRYPDDDELLRHWCNRLHRPQPGPATAAARGHR